MTNKVVKRLFLYSLSIVLLLIVVLGIHIYIVTRPKAPDAYTRAMARVDIKQPIDAAVVTNTTIQTFSVAIATVTRAATTTIVNRMARHPFPW